MKALANKARAATATKAAGCAPKKGAHKRCSGKGAPKKDRAVRNCKGAIGHTDPSKPTIPQSVSQSLERE